MGGECFHHCATGYILSFSIRYQIPFSFKDQKLKSSKAQTLLKLPHLLKVEDPRLLKYFVPIILSTKLKGVSIHHSEHTNHTSCKLSLNSFNFPAIAATLALSNDIKEVCKRKKHKVGRSTKQEFLKHLTADLNYLGKVRVLRHGRTFTRWTELIPSLAWSVTNST